LPAIPSVNRGVGSSIYC